MDFNDIRENMLVVDRYGNEYRVHAIDRAEDDRGMPIKLECIKHVKDIRVDDDFAFLEVGQRLWVYKSKGAARKYLLENTARIITVKSLRPKSEE